MAFGLLQDCTAPQVQKGIYIMMNRKTKRIVSLAIVVVLILAMIIPSLIYAFS